MPFFCDFFSALAPASLCHIDVICWHCWPWHCPSHWIILPTLIVGGCCCRRRCSSSSSSSTFWHLHYNEFGKWTHHITSILCSCCSLSKRLHLLCETHATDEKRRTERSVKHVDRLLWMVFICKIVIFPFFARIFFLVCLFRFGEFTIETLSGTFEHRFSR